MIRNFMRPSSGSTNSFTPTFFFFNDTATTEIYTLSLHDALPISRLRGMLRRERLDQDLARRRAARAPDRKSTRLNSSHGYISYAVFCLKKKNTQRIQEIDGRPESVRSPGIHRHSANLHLLHLCPS